MARGPWEVRTLTRRTPDGMLAAALDYRPGEVGIQEHLWQATLSPEAVVFTTHPGNAQEHGNARPNFWAGSARLPRVAMMDRTVICLYNLALGGGMGFSHAYFPTAAFDEYVIEGPWAFARVERGYVALWSDGDLVLTESGRHAGQELRSRGSGQVWLCHLGRAAEDGDFAAFRQRARAYTPQAEGPSVRWTTPEGHALAFAWEGPLWVDGRSQDFSDFPHYENLYTDTPAGADTMTIRHGEDALTMGVWA
jgi:hypothetical protein